MPENPHAFPVPSGEGWTLTEPGMTIRDYFAVRAPAEEADWFFFKAERLPSRDPEDIIDDWAEIDEETQNCIEQWQRDDAGADLIAFLPEGHRWAETRVRMWQDELEIRNAKIATMRSLEGRRRAALWRYAWADAMLEFRSEAAK